MGDFNAKVGNTAMSKSIGRYGLGTSNERGERMIQFCEQHDMSVKITHFKQPKRRLYTWKSPGDVTRNQIDYLAINSRFKNAVSKCKTYLGADIGSDHAPVIMKTNIKLKIPTRKSTKVAKYEVSQLKNEELQKKIIFMLSRMSQKIEREISDRQTGFRKNSGTREAIFSLKVTDNRGWKVRPGSEQENWHGEKYFFENEQTAYQPQNKFCNQITPYQMLRMVGIFVRL
ncbi:RNA-directed DNA polymerase from mobile element jockey-like [Elysia marginata]|uniref:RNA-directed DNA polymerase from mobile element jockey-like n=1 Tax=Elysia marginata TaxID=1093978 RepID=A0AAV4GMQ8_9GAST|nr:RNA-directed DNA polymerase from mobile element jockey-like [Elysia marginata]